MDAYRTIRKIGRFNGSNTAKGPAVLDTYSPLVENIRLKGTILVQDMGCNVLLSEDFWEYHSTNHHLAFDVHQKYGQKKGEG